MYFIELYPTANCNVITASHTGGITTHLAQKQPQSWFPYLTRTLFSQIIFLPVSAGNRYILKPFSDRLVHPWHILQRMMIYRWKQDGAHDPGDQKFVGRYSSYNGTLNTSPHLKLSFPARSVHASWACTPQ